MQKLTTETISVLIFTNPEQYDAEIKAPKSAEQSN